MHEGGVSLLAQKMRAAELIFHNSLPLWLGVTYPRGRKFPLTGLPNFENPKMRAKGPYNTFSQKIGRAWQGCLG